MLRAAALSLLVLVSVVVMLPTSDSSAHHGGRSSASRRSNMGKRHSRAWWRRYRARLRRKRAALRRQQTLLNARKTTGTLNSVADSHKSAPLTNKLSTVSSYKSSSSTVNPALPNGWSKRAGANGEIKFAVNAQDGRTVGTAALSIVNAQASFGVVMTARAPRTMPGGVSFKELRRTVIDKMVAAGGWVVNDFHREIGGHSAFIVLAQTPASSDGHTPQQSWVFYFTEVEGRIYSLATNSLPEFADRISGESAQLIASLHANTRSIIAETTQR
ncbi:MAG: hypothetical protein H0U54_19015 [Acidobacteria bacterium]|nr:hypothetical protein [Acidobacteriota bacterium]